MEELFIAYIVPDPDVNNNYIDSYSCNKGFT